MVHGPPRLLPLEYRAGTGTSLVPAGVERLVTRFDGRSAGIAAFMQRGPGPILRQRCATCDEDE